MSLNESDYPIYKYLYEDVWGRRGGQMIKRSENDEWEMEGSSKLTFPIIQNKIIEGNRYAVTAYQINSVDDLINKLKENEQYRLCGIAPSMDGRISYLIFDTKFPK